MPNESYYAVQKAVRALGTNSVDNAARVCHSPSTSALKQAVGVSATTCSYQDWIGTDLVVFIGANVANNQPVATKYLHYAKKAGTAVAVVNTYREPGMERYWASEADKLEWIFEPFVQLDRSLSQPGEGVGLGLAISRDLARAWITVSWLLRQRSLDDARQRRRRRSTEHLVEHYPDAVHVAGGSRDAPPSLLGRHVPRSPAHGPRGFLAAALGQPSDPEVPDLHPPATVDQHVAGLDVAMDDAVAVRFGHAAGDVALDPTGARRGQRAGFLERLGERRAGEVGHTALQLAGGGGPAVHRAHLLVLSRRR